MAGKKVYAVRKGHKTGIFKTWHECQAHTAGFSGAEFKSFKTMAEAEAYMGGGQELILDVPEADVVRAYVDGSYDHSIKMYAGGAIILYDDQEVEISESNNIEEMASMRNVAGELLGAVRAIEWFEEHHKEIGAKKLVIYHDYEGIAKWATGAWKAKKKGTQEYVEIFKQYNEHFPIEFVKVAAHTGDKYNEIADQLAKKALGLL